MKKSSHFNFPEVHSLIFFVVWSPSCDQLFETHGLWYTWLLCPSPSPGICPSSCPMNWWCHPTISSSVSLFSSCLQSFPGLGFFPMSQVYASGGQSIGASASDLPKSIQDWLPLRLTDLIFLLSKGFSRVLQHHSLKVSILRCSGFFMIWLSHPYRTIGKTIAF